MSSEKTVGVSFRVTRQFKSLLEAAARGEKRSLTNMLEVILADYCARNGIAESEADDERMLLRRGAE